MTYYLFYVDPIYRKLNNNYELYMFFKNLDDTIKSEIDYSNVTKMVNQKKINNIITKGFSNNNYYNYKNNYHVYNNKLNLKFFNLKVCRNLLILKTNHLNSHLFKILNKYSFFVCDFQNQDYFWINEFCC